MTAAGQDPKEQILTALRRHGPMTTDALMGETSLSKTATRARLLRLVREGMIMRTEEESGGVGRPPVVYELTERGAGIFPVRDAHLFARLLAFLESEGAEELVERFFEQIWEDRRDALRSSLGDLTHATLEERLASLEALLAESDFMPAIDLVKRGDGGRRVRVQECNCPLPEAVRATKIPCRLEGRFLADAVHGKLVAMTTAKDRRDTCVFEIDVDP